MSTETPDEPANAATPAGDAEAVPTPPDDTAPSGRPLTDPTDAIIRPPVPPAADGGAPLSSTPSAAGAAVPTAPPSVDPPSSAVPGTPSAVPMPPSQPQAVPTPPWAATGFASTTPEAAAPSPAPDGAAASPPAPPARRAGRTIAAVVGALALLAAGFGIGAAVGGDDGDTDDATATSASIVQADPADGRPTGAPVSGDDVEPTAAVAEAVAPAVVQIETGDGLGAGIIYDADGYVLTNAHVVGSADEVRVVLADGRRFDGDVLGADRSRDVAVVEFDPGDEVLPVAVLAVGDEIRVGQLAVAVGSPFGLEQTVTAGIISAVGRPVSGPNDLLVVGMLQTDAPINSGNSGGALADRHGRVIGVNTSITSRSGDNSGIGFAIPITIAARVGDSIIAGDIPEPTFLGVRGPADGESIADGQAGALIGEVTPGSAADGALQEGDIIVTIDGHGVRNFEALAGFIGSYLPGDQVTLGVLRDGDRLDIDVVLAERDESLLS